MTRWWTYRPEDFLLFSERVYWRLFELQNEALWPAQVIALMAGAGMLFILVRPRPWGPRAIALVLAAAWVITAWTFLWQRYAPINWAVTYAVPLFAVEALLILWWGGERDRFVPSRQFDIGGMAGVALFAYALAVHPLTAVAGGRPIQAAEVFAIAPDPTAIATLGVLSLARGGWPVRVLFVIPAAWCVLSAATLYAMGAWEGLIPAAAVVIAILARLATPRSAAGQRA